MSIYDAQGNVIPTGGGGEIETFSFFAKFTEYGTVAGYNPTTYIHTQRIGIKQGDNIQYAGRIKSASVCYIYDVDGNIIWRSADTSGNDSGSTVAPAKSAYVMCQTMSSGHSDYVEHDFKLIVSGSFNRTEESAKLIISVNGKGNIAIRCGKEQVFNDGSNPVIEYFLLEEPETGRFFISRDMREKTYAFTFRGDPEKYSFGILQNGDVIAVRDAASLHSLTKDDTQRLNPFVMLASEGWTIQHEVDFGDDLKPCGWLENCGFKTFPNGVSLFCEYTRRTVATANVWKINGNPLVASNWTVTKSFAVTTTDDASGFKHCHAINHDQYTDIVYLSTGDDSSAAGIWYSLDFGSTWTQIGILSEKYCRLLNIVFTKDVVYWATDTDAANIHYLFKASRDANGIIDWESIVDYVNLPALNYQATYGIAHLTELNAIFLFERTDHRQTVFNVRMVDLNDGSLHSVAELNSVGGVSAYCGFRTRFSEWYPLNGFIRVGYDCRKTSTQNDAINNNAIFGNEANANHGNKNINNLAMQIYRTADSFGINFSTYYL